MNANIYIDTISMNGDLVISMAILMSLNAKSKMNKMKKSFIPDKWF
jgi:hypothetical protein